MLYSRFIKTKRSCPFCRADSRCFKELKGAYLTYALAPYSRYHLLVIPKRHVVSLTELRPVEDKDIDNLIAVGIKILERMRIRNVTVLVRNGSENKQKSVAHLHYHIIPNHRIGDLDSKGKPRRILTGKEIKDLMRRINTALYP